MKYRAAMITGAVLVLATLSALAAARFRVKCEHPECDFSTTYFDPNSFSTRAVAGYCAHCKDIVTISSGAVEERRKREEMRKSGMDVSELGPIENDVKPKFTVWDPMTGKTRRLYECRRCKNLFFPYDFKFCPQCKRPSLKTEQVGDHYD